jgi:hypothetical protein
MEQPVHFAVTFDYLCPFARNAHEHILTALSAGAPWDVDFVPFSLVQNHLEPDDPPVFADLTAKGVLALQVAIATRALVPDKFLGVHAALFAARHDHGLDLTDRSVIDDVLTAQGVSSELIFDEIATGNPANELARSHESARSDHEVFGVPTFIAAGSAVFVRVMTRPDPETDSAAVINQILDLVASTTWLNEFKHTTIAR